MSPTSEHRRLLRQLAEAYYVRRHSKVRIAEDFSLSRFQVARLLEESIEAGVVTISVESGTDHTDDRGRLLAEALNLRQVIVVEGADGPDGEHGTSVSTAAMGRAALDQVAELARPGQRIGISWSRTLDAASDALPVLPRCTIVQLAGALPPWGQGAERSLFTRLAQDPALRIIRLYAPLLVTAAGTADDLVTLPEIDLALRAADGLDLALVSVGGWGDGFSSVWAKCCPDEREHATRAGAVAEVSGRLLALDGTPVDTLDGRVIAVSLDQLREARTTVGVAPGPERADAVLAACAAGILDVAVVDSALADVLLERLPASVHSGQDT